MKQRPMRVGILLWVLVVAALAGGCGRKSVFTSQEGRFSVETASVPKPKREVVPTRDGPVGVYTLTFEMQNPDLEYWVVYIDYPESTVRQKGPEQLLKEARDGSVDNVKGRLLKERDITLEGYPGKEIEYEEEGGGEEIYKSRMYLAKQRLYVILVIGPRDGTSDRGEKFLNSFKLL